MFYFLRDSVLSWERVLSVFNLDSNHAPLPMLCSGCPHLASVPLTSQQVSWTWLFRRHRLQAPLDRWLSCSGPGFNVTSPVQFSRTVHGNCQPPLSLTPWLIILFLEHLSPSAVILFISSRIDFPSAPKRMSEGRDCAFLA